MNIKDEIEKIKALPDEVLASAFRKRVTAQGLGYREPSQIENDQFFAEQARKALQNLIFDRVFCMYAELESQLPKQEQDLTDLRRSVSQCTTVEYCKGWNDAIKAVQEQQNRVDKNIEEANEALRKRVEPVNPELYKAMVGEQEQGLAVIFDRYSTDKDSHYPLMDFYGFQQAVLELQQPKFPSDEEIKVKIEKLVNDPFKFTDTSYIYENEDGEGLSVFDNHLASETLANFAKWLKGEK